MTNSTNNKLQRISFLVKVCLEFPPFFLNNTFINLIKYTTKYHHKYEVVCCKLSNVPTCFRVEVLKLFKIVHAERVVSASGLYRGDWFLIDEDGRCVLLMMSMMREWSQQVRVGGRTSENSGELILRIEIKNFMCRFVMNV
jgi:hypothetical protein